MNTNPDSHFDAVDAVLAAKVGSLPVPPDLRDRVLSSVSAAGGEPREARESSWGGGGLMALAAALALVVLGALGALSGTGRGGSVQGVTREMAAFFSSDFQLVQLSDQSAVIKEWFAANNDGRELDIPQGLAGDKTVGCREVVWQGRRGSLVCFRLADGKVAHLVVFPSEVFRDPPAGSPTVLRVGRWDRTAWSRDGMTYLLFVPLGVDGVI